MKIEGTWPQFLEKNILGNCIMDEKSHEVGPNFPKMWEQ
jgi:hypothetical protein